MNYLTSLRCPNGNTPFIERLGSTFGGFENPTDVFSLLCPSGEEHRIFVDSYHCEEVDPLVQVGDLKPYYLSDYPAIEAKPKEAKEGDWITL